MDYDHLKGLLRSAFAKADADMTVGRGVQREKELEAQQNMEASRETLRNSGLEAALKELKKFGLRYDVREMSGAKKGGISIETNIEVNGNNIYGNTYKIEVFKNKINGFKGLVEYDPLKDGVLKYADADVPDRVSGIDNVIASLAEMVRKQFPDMPLTGLEGDSSPAQTKFIQERQPSDLLANLLEHGAARGITPEQNRKEIDERTAEFRKQWIRRMHSH